jgi:coproporphyrinogen III oxidase-like Fe-S oxidoreductase
MEAAPGTVTAEKATAWVCRINRVSLGVQSFITA